MLRAGIPVRRLGRSIITAMMGLFMIKAAACSSGDVDWYYPELCVPHAPCPVSTGVGGVSGTGGGDGTGGTGGQSQAECMFNSDCPPPPDAQCGTAKCLNGVCGFKIKEDPISSQIKGDCHTWVCGETGTVVTIEDPDDWYNDGKPCTTNECKDGSPVNPPLMNGIVCPEIGSGACYNGDCLSCIDDPNFSDICLTVGYVCDTHNMCVPKTCTHNNKKDGPETDVDCGGPCVPCAPTYQCVVNADCAHGVCKNKSCALPTCSDGVRNGIETGIDCGSPSCGECPDGQRCATSKNCKSGVCWAGVCEAPKCTDGLKNGNELGLDCGGPCSPCLP